MLTYKKQYCEKHTQTEIIFGYCVECIKELNRNFIKLSDKKLSQKELRDLKKRGII